MQVGLKEKTLFNIV